MSARHYGMGLGMTLMHEAESIEHAAAVLLFVMKLNDLWLGILGAD